MKKLWTLAVAVMLSLMLTAAAGAAKTDKSDQNTADAQHMSKKSSLSKRNQLKMDQAEQAKLRRDKLRSGAYSGKLK